MGTKLKFFSLGVAVTLLVLSIQFWPYWLFYGVVVFNEMTGVPCGGLC